MAQQEGLDRGVLKENYYDIMLIGMTGQGKSTTADKLLIANPQGIRYTLPEKTDLSLPPGQGQDKVNEEDFSMWLLHQEDQKNEFETRLKGLVCCRTCNDPHFKVNDMRDPKNKIFEGTIGCQVVSNDITKIRILDVPGFNDGRAFKTPTNPTPSAKNFDLNAVYKATKEVTSFNIGITRNIIRIQAALGMYFRRIVYFLPVRGPLERVDALLKTELQSLEIAFGRSIFECMVVIATIPKRFSLRKESDDDKFPQEDIQQCEECFQMALREALGIGPNEKEPKVPIVFLSLSESCESILNKIQNAKVTCSGLKLSFNPSTCANCGLKIGSMNGERVTCSFPQDPSSSFPYNESTCHPAFRQSFLRVILGQTISHMISQKWPSYKEEYCIECKQRPFEQGCKQVKTKYRTWWGKVYVVDHTSEVSKPVNDDELAAESRGDQSSGQQGEVATPLPPQDIVADQCMSDRSGGPPQATATTLSFVGGHGVRADQLEGDVARVRVSVEGEGAQGSTHPG